MAPARGDMRAARTKGGRQSGIYRRPASFFPECWTTCWKRDCASQSVDCGLSPPRVKQPSPRGHGGSITTNAVKPKAKCQRPKSQRTPPHQNYVDVHTSTQLRPPRIPFPSLPLFLQSLNSCNPIPLGAPIVTFIIACSSSSSTCSTCSTSPQ
jgi:hypothetical protein